jgi:HJR/Mrr/RecB family endonuclease
MKKQTALQELRKEIQLQISEINPKVKGIKNKDDESDKVYKYVLKRVIMDIDRLLAIEEKQIKDAYYSAHRANPYAYEHSYKSAEIYFDKTYRKSSNEKANRNRMVS